MILAHDNQVKAMEWFKPEVESEQPTQRQRARFAMLGKNMALGEEELKPIEELEINIRNLYKKLSSVAHLKNYEGYLERETESLIDHYQVYLLKLLEMRESYFIP